MNEKRKWIEYCLSLSDSYEDYPFDDANWAVMRHRENRKSFALIYERHGALWINVKAEPSAVELWRQMYDFAYEVYHMNKRHWLSLKPGRDADEEQIRRLIRESYALTRKKPKKAVKNGGTAGVNG